ncbi:MAG: hypothetical protein QOJ57_1114 [Thermoleophilaceae bacterium]|jgi:hypothetical protein|nr:hypothetical protein [Thermoleophilaceae bacterium]
MSPQPRKPRTAKPRTAKPRTARQKTPTQAPVGPPRPLVPAQPGYLESGLAGYAMWRAYYDDPRVEVPPMPKGGLRGRIFS